MRACPDKKAVIIDERRQGNLAGDHEHTAARVGCKSHDELSTRIPIVAHEKFVENRKDAVLTLCYIDRHPGRRYS